MKQKLTSRKFWLSLIALATIIAKWAITGVPPAPEELGAAILAVVSYVAVEGVLDLKALLLNKDIQNALQIIREVERRGN